jgi:PAS domain S-box-containing protein
MGDRVNNLKKLDCPISQKQNQQSITSEFEQLIDESDDAIRVINSDFTIRKLNKAFTDMTHIDQDTAIGRKCWEIFPSALCNTLKCRAQRILNGENQIRMEIERQKQDGTTIPCILITFPLKDSSGNIIGIFEQFRDITEIRYMKEQVQESEDRYRSLINLEAEAGEAVVMLQDIDGKEGIQTFVSAQWPHITGYSKEKLLGTCFFDLICEKDKNSSIARHRQKISGKPVPGMFEMNIKRKDGTEVTVELTGAFTNYQGKHANVLYLRDVTDRKQAEQKVLESEELYRDLFQNVPVAIIEFDFSQVKKYYDELRARGVTDFRDLFFNSAREELLNCETRLKLTKINSLAVRMFQVSNADDYVKHLINIHKMQLGGDEGPRECHTGLAEGKTYFDYVESFPALKGGRCYHHTWVSVAPGCEETLSRVYVCFIDISARKNAETELKAYQANLQNLVNERTAQLKQEVAHSRLMEEKVRELYEKESRLRQELETQTRQRIEFTRALIHDLKTPLTPMLGASQILLDTAQDAKLKRIALNINKGTQNLNNSINDLVDITRGEVGILKLIYKETDVFLMLKEIMDFVKPGAIKMEQKISLNTSGSSPIVWCDEDRLRQVVLNLLDNALKFTPYGGSIHIRAGISDKELRVEIKDTGCGIAQEDQVNLFTPYYQSRVKKEKLSGLGLGLPLSKMLIELHHGNIWVKSKLSAGTTVGFSIPITNDAISQNNVERESV